MRSTCRHYRVNTREIAYLKFILEAYEGIAVLSTLDPASGLVQIQVPPGCGGIVDAVIDDLTGSVMIVPVETGTDPV